MASKTKSATEENTSFNASDEDDCFSSSEDFDLEECARSPSPSPMPQSSADAACATAAPAAAANPTAKSSATKAASALIIAASDKAGMAGVDRERINSILLRESGNSAFMRRQREMDEISDRRIEEMRRRLERKEGSAAVNNDWRREIERSATDPLLRGYRSRRRPVSTCVVIDMDGFFISCHTLLDPHLAEIPACVGGTSMISTSNYAARKYGVRAAMPGYLGSALVKELSGGKETLAFVRSDFGLYKRKSAEVKSVLEEYDPHLKMYSLDEGYMDIGPYLEVQLLNQKGGLSHEDVRKKMLDHAEASSVRRHTEQNKNQSASQSPHREFHDMVSPSSIHAAAKDLLNSIRQRVRDVTGLTCSAGLASNFLLSKIASDVNKPNGQCFIGPSERQVLEFVNPLPIRKVSGIGRVMEKTLRGVCGIETVKDLYEKRAEVHFLFKPASAGFLLRASIGYAEGGHRDESADDGDAEQEALNRKGMSHERTFSPTSSWGEMCTRLEGIALNLAQDLRERNLRPKTVTLKVKLANFNILSRASTREVALFQHCNDRQSSRELVDIVIGLLKDAKREHGIAVSEKEGKTAPAPNVGSSFSVRLLGVRCSNFQLEKDNQSSLDRYRTAVHLDGDEVPAPDLPQTRGNISPKVKNPYVSPKAKNPYVSPKTMPLREKIIGNQTKSSSSSSSSSKTSRRALYSSFPFESNCTVAQPPESETTRSNTSNTRIQCPICKKQFRTDKDNNVVINSHIDACLNATTVKHLAKEETKCAEERTKKKQKRRLADFFGS